MDYPWLVKDVSSCNDAAPVCPVHVIYAEGLAENAGDGVSKLPHGFGRSTSKKVGPTAELTHPNTHAQNEIRLQDRYNVT